MRECLASLSRMMCSQCTYIACISVLPTGELKRQSSNISLGAGITPRLQETSILKYGYITRMLLPQGAGYYFKNVLAIKVDTRVFRWCNSPGVHLCAICDVTGAVPSLVDFPVIEAMGDVVAQALPDGVGLDPVSSIPAPVFFVRRDGRLGLTVKEAKHSGERVLLQSDMTVHNQDSSWQRIRISVRPSPARRTSV